MFASYSRLARRAAGPGVVATSLSLWSERRLAQQATAGKLISAGASSIKSRLFSSSSSASKRNGIVAWYEGHLHNHPVFTKMVTGACLWSIGDAVAQYAPSLASQQPLADYDYARTGRACAFGFFLHAPLSHLHFNFLEYLTVKSGFKGMQITIFKTTMEQFVYWSWISNCLYHGAMGAMQGQSVQQTWDYIKSVIWETQKATWVFWIPVQLLNFRYVPVRHQLNVVLCTSIVWTALLSFWFPPIGSDDKKKKKKKNVEDYPVM
ncbi:hypothetical protein MPSEU_000341300 [Mayamaea pseudoterrestris]|nr:hypothetical protein MPSEU_000341300 [Mayamaea pseudoterrestris]